MNKLLFRCQKCKPGSYLLNQNLNAETCISCPSQFQCQGGDLILLNPGYWRSNVNSDQIFFCEIYHEKCLLVFFLNLNYYVSKEVAIIVYVAKGMWDHCVGVVLRITRDLDPLTVCHVQTKAKTLLYFFYSP